MTDKKMVVKCDLNKEIFDLEKIHKVLMWATKDITNVSVSDIEMKASFDLVDGVSTIDIHASLIKAAAELISEETPNYQFVAARLVLFRLRKEVYGQYTPRPLIEQLRIGTDNARYTSEILAYYSLDEINKLGTHIDHDRDYDLSYSGINEFRQKYLVQHRKSKTIYETPQMCFMIQAMANYVDVPDKEERMTLCINDYNAVSTFKMSLPTPIMAGLRTPVKQFSSCVVIECDDTVESIAATGSAINKYVSRKAGIGVSLAKIRAEHSEIRGGDATHTGITPIARKIQSDVKSFSSGGVRGGAATCYFPLWHLEIEQILNLKNEKGTEDNRVRRLDYGILFNTFLYQRLLSNGKISLFSPQEVPDLYKAFYDDQDKFKELYEQYESVSGTLRQYASIPAVELFDLWQTERAETGRYYWTNIDSINVYGKFKPLEAPVRLSNLCVAPETKILTRNGYTVISELENEHVDIWNGEEWSNVHVLKTGTDQKLITVTTANGQSLDCTEYHKFYKFNGYWKPCIEVSANELIPGDKLIKFDLPTIEGKLTLNDAYINGFYSADGCLLKNGHQRVYLYHEKRKLVEHFSGGSKWFVDEAVNRQYKHYDNLHDKFFVPGVEYTIESRLAWLSGFLDGDGCVQNNGTNQSIVAASIELEFLKELQMMLQTMGLSTKIIKANEAGYRMMPANDGSGLLKEFWCKDSWRILITSNDLYRLSCLGFKCNRLEFKKRLPQRDAKQFVKVESITDNGRVDDTYCFTEPKRGMGMFNGILTGQCSEITLPTRPLQYDMDPEGWIALCTLAAANMGEIKKLADLENICYIMVRKLDELLDYQEYPVPAAKTHMKLFRPLGIGVINYAYWLAKNNLTYDHTKPNYQESLDRTHEFFEAFQYYLIKASVKLAKEKGKCDGYEMTKWSDGILPIDLYKKEVDNLTDIGYNCDWESLRVDLKKYGIRNATLSALMPAETSAKISNATNGIEPVRGLVQYKGGKESLTAQVVPEIRRLKNKYDLLWDLESPEGYIGLLGVMQKFICQSISANTSYNPHQEQYVKYGGKVPISLMLRHQLYATKVGLRSGYYNNTYDGNEEETVDECGGACTI